MQLFFVSHSKFNKFTIEKIKRILFNNYNELNEVTTDAVQQKNKRYVLIYVKGILNKQESR